MTVVQDHSQLRDLSSFFPEFQGEAYRRFHDDPGRDLARLQERGAAQGEDLESPGFWIDSIAIVEEDLKRFESLALEVRR